MMAGERIGWYRYAYVYVYVCVMEIILDLPFGFPINNIFSLSITYYDILYVNVNF